MFAPLGFTVFLNYIKDKWKQLRLSRQAGQSKEEVAS
jgi:hypothetical protein